MNVVQDVLLLLKDNKNLFNLFTLIVILLALPVGVGLVRQRQILDSQAFSGSAFSVVDDEKVVKVRAGKYYSSQPTFNIQLYSPFDSGNSVTLAPQGSDLANAITNFRNSVVPAVKAQGFSGASCGYPQNCDPGDGNPGDGQQYCSGTTGEDGSCNIDSCGSCSYITPPAGGGDNGSGGGDCSIQVVDQGTICGGTYDVEGHQVGSDPTHSYSFIEQQESDCSVKLNAVGDQGPAANCGAPSGEQPGGQPAQQSAPSNQPPEGQDCQVPVFQWNQCIACNSSQPVWKDSCGNWSTGAAQSDSQCASWCPSTGPAQPTQTKTSTPPTQSPPPAQATQSSTSVSCNSVALSVSVNGSQGVFNVSGDASTFYADSFSGGVSTCNVGPTGGGSCTLTGSGTWTRTWKHCVGDTNHCSSTCSASTSFSASGGSGTTSTPTPAAVTDYVLVADNPSFDNAQKYDYPSLVAQSNIVSYTIPVADQSFSLTHPLPLYAKFHATDGSSTGKFSQVYELGSFYLVGADPQASTLGCQVDLTASGVSFELFGSNFGDGSEPGSLQIDNAPVSVTKWSDTEIDADLSSVPSNTNQSYQLSASRADGAGITLSGAPLRCSIGVSEVLVQTAPACASLSSLSQSGQLKSVKVGLLDETTGQTDAENASIDDQGVIQGLAAKLTTGHHYRLSLKAPGTLSIVSSEFIGASGTTTPQNLVLPVGDIYPVGSSTGAGRGDGSINALDYAELKREWGSSLNSGTARPGDLNGDGVVNSVDWACMKQFFGKSDESLPTAQIASPSAALEGNPGHG